ncbi:MAG: GntR family transcriptional regulator [Verrucomicrobia bacterium]|nr:GntR family transcriptional regulator [Verrucomicrobiota bacterium]
MTRNQIAALLNPQRRIAPAQRLQGYREIATHIRDTLRSHQLPSDTQLPTLLELSKLFRVAPMTIRRAIDLLREKGWLVAVARKGIRVRKGWGNPPAQFHVTIMLHEFHSPDNLLPLVIPWLFKGLRRAFENISIQISILPCHAGNALEAISRGCLDTGVDAVLSFTLITADVWDFLKSQNIPMVSLRYAPHAAYPCILLDKHRMIRRAITHLAAHANRRRPALISYSNPRLEIERIRKYFHEMTGGQQLILDNDHRLDKVDYSVVYPFLKKERPRQIITGDETLAFHVRRAAILYKFECHIVMLDCVTPGLVWPGDAFFDTMSFCHDASFKAGQILREWLLRGKPPREKPIQQVLAPRLLTAPDLAQRAPRSGPLAHNKH